MKPSSSPFSSPPPNRPPSPASGRSSATPTATNPPSPAPSEQKGGALRRMLRHRPNRQNRRQSRGLKGDLHLQNRTRRQLPHRRIHRRHPIPRQDRRKGPRRRNSPSKATLPQPARNSPPVAAILPLAANIFLLTLLRRRPPPQPHHQPDHRLNVLRRRPEIHNAESQHVLPIHHRVRTERLPAALNQCQQPLVHHIQPLFGPLFNPTPA